MPLSPGDKIGPYEIVAPIGAGGMGEVYRARDTKLGRDVAIKCLPDALAQDPERRARFDREAKVLAALSHPNIAQIYCTEDRAIVMELVEGEPLHSGKLGLRKTIEIAAQIAGGLAAAHDAGIVHRDLKPDNILLTRDSRPKILDFGLAKVRTASAGQTATMLTGTGAVLGTVGYMSPEQVRGLATDHRSDIFSFGVILHELLTGNRVFQGQTAADTMQAILREEPPVLPETVPPGLRQIVVHCLEKDAGARFQSARDLQFALSAIARSDSQSPVRSSPVRSAWHMRALAAVGVIGALLAGAWLLRRSGQGGDDSPEMRVEIDTPPTNDPRSFALSPDGRQLAFVASTDGQSRLWVRQLASTKASPLTTTDGPAYPFWSPDSRSVGFFSGGKLKRIAAGGGLPQIVTDAKSGRGATWNADGVIVFAPAPASPLFRVPASGGESSPLTKLKDWEAGQRFPQFLPDGRHYLYYSEGSPENPGPGIVGSIYLGSLDSSDGKRLTGGDTAGLYMPPGWLLWVRAGILVARHLNVARGELSGDVVTVADPLFFDTSHARLFSVSATGLVTYRNGMPVTQLRWFDRSGKALSALAEPTEKDGYNPSNARISPDGRRVAVHRRVRDRSDIWLIDEGHANRFTFEGAGSPVWSPDGRQIMFNGGKRGNSRFSEFFFRKRADGTQSAVLVADSLPDTIGGLLDWSSEGDFLLFSSINPTTGYDLWTIPLEGDRKPRVFLRTNFDEKYGRFSPDSHWVAYTSNESGRAEVYVRAFADPEAAGGGQGAGSDVWQVSAEGGLFPAWRHDGRELYWVGPGGRMMAAPIAAKGKTLETGPPVELFQTPIFGGGLDMNTGGQQFDVAADGRFLINTVKDIANTAITLLQNWKP